MKYLKNRKNHKIETLNEEFIGKALKGLFKSAVSKMAVNLSKQIGSAGEVDKLIEQYKNQLNKLEEEKMDKLKSLIELEKSRIEGAEIEEDIVKKAKGEYEKSMENFKKQKDNLKKKFDLQFKKIVEKEESENIKDYIQLKKIDMVQELLESEMERINTDMGVTEDDIESSEIIAEVMNKSKKEAENMKKLQGKIEKKVSEDQKEDEEEIEYKAGQEITYTKKDGEDNTGKIADSQEDVEEGYIRVTTENSPNGFVIKKEQIKKEEKEEKTAEGGEGSGV